MNNQSLFSLSLTELNELYAKALSVGAFETADRLQRELARRVKPQEDALAVA